jgi:hypothetical protein
LVFGGRNVYIQGRLLSGGNVREAYIPEIQQSSEVCKHYDRQKTKRFEEAAQLPFLDE